MPVFCPSEHPPSASAPAPGRAACNPAILSGRPGLEPPIGFEPMTPSLPWKCSTSELRRQAEVVRSTQRPNRHQYIGLETHAPSRPPISTARTRPTSRPHHILPMSGRRDSNPRPSAWKADALPSELLPQNDLFDRHRSTPTMASPLQITTSGQGRIRTCEG